MSTVVMVKDNTYFTVLERNRVRYIPSCLLIQMIIKIYSQISVVNMAGSLETLVPDLIGLLDQLTRNILQTANAYKNGGSMFFPGDWKNDRPRARKFLYEILSRVGYVGELLGCEDRKKFQEAVRRTAAAWLALDGIMEEKANRDRELPPDSRTMPYFRSENRASWKQVMARSILELDAECKRDEPDRRLLLVCYRRVKNGLVSEIDALERRKMATRRFDPNRLVCIYHDDLPIACSNCTLMTGCVVNTTRKAVRGCYLRRQRDTMQIARQDTRAGSLGSRRQTSYRGLDRR